MTLNEGTDNLAFTLNIYKDERNRLWLRFFALSLQDVNDF